MKKTSYYLIFIVAAGLALVSFWIYQKYFQEAEPELLKFKVERGDIQETVRARGEVAPQKDFNLSFPFSGIVEKVFVREGQEVSSETALMKLETIQLEIQFQETQALLGVAQAKLDKLLAGASPEEIKIVETQVENARIALGIAKENLKNSYEGVITVLDGSHPPIYNALEFVKKFIRSYVVASDQDGIKITLARDKIEGAEERAKLYLEMAKNDSKNENIELVLSVMKNSLETVFNNLEIIREIADNSAFYRDNVSATDRASLDTLKTNINSAISNVISAQQTISSMKLNVESAQGQLQKAEDQLAQIKAEPRQEDIDIARSQVKETESQIAILEEKIKKSTIFALVSAKVAKIFFEEQELFSPGQTAISLFTSGYKIQSDISELDIGKVREVDGNEVLIRLDAFPDREFKGQVVSIEPKEVIKEGDKYYRVNIVMEPPEVEIRSGMNVDLEIEFFFKEDVLKIPELAVYEKEGKKFVGVLEKDQIKEVEIETGISDGETVEVARGLEEGQTVVVSAD